MGRLIKVALAAALAGGLAASAADAEGIFNAFGGVYRGAGRVSDVNGRSEALTCRSNNAPSRDGIALNLTLVCASDSYRVDFHSDLYTDGRALRGTWSEATRGATGDVTGSIDPSIINVTASAPGFSAKIVIHVETGGRLEISLNASGSSINHVVVSMRK